MVDIARTPRKVKTIPLVSLVDVVFQLLIYFMLTTSFTRSESLELALPDSAKPAVAQAAAADAKTLHVYISNTGEIFIERDSVGGEGLSEALAKVFMDNPDRGVLVMSASKVSVGSLVKVLDRIYTAGGKNIAVADWIMTKTSAGKPHEGGNG